MTHSNFVKALTTNDSLTENLMPTNSTSSHYVLDMFFKLGGSRNLSGVEIENIFNNAIAEDKLLAMKAMFYNGDIREGQGERRSFKTMVKFLSFHYPVEMRKNMHLVPFYGRWDYVLEALDTPSEEAALALIKAGLEAGDALCAKWMPRENKNREVATKIMNYLGWTPRTYRKTLVNLTKVVETQMCQQEWTDIKYEQVPSKASHLYRRAFARHNPDGYVSWLNKVEKGESKVNASAIFPHDVIRPFFSYYGNTDDRLIEAQWKALPNYMPEGRKIISVCDVSGSMSGQPMEVCVALGIYTAERNVGPFKDAFITFSAVPKLQVLTGRTLRERVHSLNIANWDMNTNLEAVFRLILDKAKAAGLPNEDLPDEILILSDMQFDQCTKVPSDSAIQMIKRMYEDAGYKLPNVVFWNLRTSSGLPVKFDTSGTALVSGFSPSILKNIMSGEIDPLKIMSKTLNSDRYEPVTL